jgi:hypothetical protein
LNCLENPRAKSGSNYITNPTATGCFSQEQINWLIDVLLNTPEDYGVALTYHSSIGNITTLEHKFSVRAGDVLNMLPSGQTGNPVVDIIQAWIDKTTLSQTYPFTGTVETAADAWSIPDVSAVCDFSGRTTSKFFAHLTGHLHADVVAKYNGTDQVVLLIDRGTSYPYSTMGDIYREDNTKSETLFNVVAFNTDDMTIRIVRIGADVTCDMVKRDIGIIQC